MAPGGLYRLRSAGVKDKPKLEVNGDTRSALGSVRWVVRA